MLKHTMTYTDFNGEEQTDTFYFNLTKLECLELDLGVKGGLEGFLHNLVETKDYDTLIKEFKKIILASIGKKSPDGKRFMKSDEIRDEFSQTNAFVDLFMQMVMDATFASDFIRQVVPQVPDMEEITSVVPSDNVKPLLSEET